MSGANPSVLATGVETEFGRVYRLTGGTESGPSPLQRQVARMARRVAAVALSVGALLFVVRLTRVDRWWRPSSSPLGVMVPLVPEGLPATLSVWLAFGVRQMARRNALVKKLLAVEALGLTTVICTDKTGTLTTAEMTVQAIWESGQRHPVTGVGYEPSGSVGGRRCRRRDTASGAPLLQRQAAQPGPPQGAWAGECSATPQRAPSWWLRARQGRSRTAATGCSHSCVSRRPESSSAPP